MEVTTNMNTTREVYLHFGHDSIHCYPHYYVESALIIGWEYFTNQMITNLISECILEHTKEDITLNIWDPSGLYFDKKSPEDFMEVDFVNWADSSKSGTLYDFMESACGWVEDRIKVIEDSRCSSVYQYERKIGRTLPTLMIVINNWEDAVKNDQDISLDSFISKVRYLVTNAESRRITIILSSAIDIKLPDDLQKSFSYIVHGKDCENVLAKEYADHAPNLASALRDAAVITPSSNKTSTVAVPVFSREDIIDIIKGERTPYNHGFGKDRLAEIRKLYNMKGAVIDEQCTL